MRKNTQKWICVNSNGRELSKFNKLSKYVPIVFTKNLVATKCVYQCNMGA